MKFIAVSSIALFFVSQVIAKPIEGCLKNYTITEADSCVSVAAQFQLAEADFYKMNPGLHHSVAHDCDNLDTGKPYCVCIQEPCSAGVVVPGASNTTSATNATLPSTAIVSSTAAAAASISASASVSASAATPSAVLTNATSIASVPSSKSSIAASSSQSTQAENSASTAAIFGAAAIGMTLAATSLLL